MKIKLKRELSFSLNCNMSAYDFLFWVAYIPWLFWYAIKATTFSYFLPEVTTKLISLYVIGVLAVRWFVKGRYTIRRAAITGIFFGGFTISYIITSRITFIATMFVILSAYDVNFRKIVKISLAIFLSVMFMAIACSKVGIIENHIFIQEGRTRESLGYTYAGLINVMFMNCFYMIMYLLGDKMKLWHWIIGIGLMSFFYIKTQTRTDMFIILGLFVLWLLLLRRKTFTTDRFIFKAAATLIYPFVAVLSIVLTFIYNDRNRTWQKINEALSSRLNLARKMYLKEGYNLFGHDIELVGNTSVLVGNKRESDYNYIDNGYLQVAFLYGLFTLGVLVIAYTVVTRYAAKNNEKYLMVWLCMNAIENFIYPNLINPDYNILCMLLVITHIHIIDQQIPGVMNRLLWQKKRKKIRLKRG
ncbi:MAG TPA: hypothetical protein P5191_03065 [Ruminococcus sp.]|nr:hypothetical protein [Ruminococcus sp.]